MMITFKNEMFKYTFLLLNDNKIISVENTNMDFDVFLHVDGLMQERCNSIAKALELYLSCTNPSLSCWW